MNTREFLRSKMFRLILGIGSGVFAIGLSLGIVKGLATLQANFEAGLVPAGAIAGAALAVFVSVGMRLWESRREFETWREARTRARDADSALVDAIDSAFNAEEFERHSAELERTLTLLDAKLLNESINSEIAAQLRQERDELRQRLARVTIERDREREELLLAPTWRAVNERLTSYHLDAQRHGRIAFRSAMSAMILGFLLLAVSGWFALGAQSTAGATVAGALGATSAIVSGYVSRTFLRTYQETSTQLRGYFAQPVEAARFLFAERAIAVSGLPDSHRKELMYALVQAMATGSMDSARGNYAPVGEPVASPMPPFSGTP